MERGGGLLLPPLVFSSPWGAPPLLERESQTQASDLKTSGNEAEEHLWTQADLTLPDLGSSHSGQPAFPAAASRPGRTAAAAQANELTG